MRDFRVQSYAQQKSSVKSFKDYVATMGNYLSSIASMSNTAVHSVYRGRKRKYIEECDSESESDYIDRTLHTPKK